MTGMISPTDIERDLDIITQAMSLCSIVRYMNQRFWEPQTEQTKRALALDEISGSGTKGPRGESVADHTWHMSYMAMVLVPRFPQLDLGRCLQLITMHDLLEIFTGDMDPLGKDGDGTDTHAFNPDKKREKQELEFDALKHYLTLIHDAAKPTHQNVIEDAIHLKSPESKFVKAIDRLQCYMYMAQRKDGVMEDGHLVFTLKMMSTSYGHFPELKPYHDVLRTRFIASIAKARNTTIAALEEQFGVDNLVAA